MRFGICSTCQSKHPVHYVQSRNGFGEYLLSSHVYPGTTIPCGGSGMIPEVVIGDSVEQRDRDEWDALAIEHLMEVP